MSGEQFWRLTMRQLAALMKRHQTRIDQEYYHSGLIATVLLNINRERGKSPYKIEDFIPSMSRKGKSIQKPTEGQTQQQMMERSKAITESLGGTVKVVKKQDG